MYAIRTLFYLELFISLGVLLSSLHEWKMSSEIVTSPYTYMLSLVDAKATTQVKVL